MKINPFLLTDYYKVGHVFQYPCNTTLVYSNLTPRSSRLEGVDEMGLGHFAENKIVLRRVGPE